MQFDIITIFPESLRGYFNSSILRRAQKDEVLEINLHNLRDFADDKYKKVDDKSYGGGPGMVMKIEPIVKAIGSIFKSKVNPSAGGQKSKVKVILFSPTGKQFTQKMARDWAKKYDNLILICGRYEGIDARVKKIVKAKEISVGPYILTGGELPAAVVVDAVARHIHGALGKQESLEESRGVGFPVYTKPEIFDYNGKKYKTPKMLLSGNHKKIQKWRQEHSKYKVE